jgi:hypothetical protein
MVRFSRPVCWCVDGAGAGAEEPPPNSRGGLAEHVLNLETAGVLLLQLLQLLFEDDALLVAVAVHQQHLTLGLLGQHGFQNRHQRGDARAGPDQHQGAAGGGAARDGEVAHRHHSFHRLAHFHRVEQVVADQAAGHALHRHGQARGLGGRAAERVRAALRALARAAGHDERQKLAGLAGNRGAVGALQVDGHGVVGFAGYVDDVQGQVRAGAHAGSRPRGGVRKRGFRGKRKRTAAGLAMVLQNTAKPG